MKKSGLNLSRVFALTLGLSTLAACAQMCASDQVATGVAQLTIRNVGAMVSLLGSDTNCGFKAASVLASPTSTGAVGSEGSVTWTVTDCVLDLGEREVSKDCQDVTTTANGKVTVSATKTVGGILTGNPLNPVLPGGPDAATIVISKATFENFKVTKSNSDNILTMVEGSISAKAMPRLAVDSTNGACSVITPNVSFSDVVYAKSTINLNTRDIDENIPVGGSSLTAQNGIKGGDENMLKGTITIWDAEHTLPLPEDTAGLDPDYDAAKFVESFACATVNPTMVTPVSYQCADMTPRLADGAARLTVKIFAAVAAAVAADTSCGFSATAVAGSPTFSGAVGSVGDTTFTVTNCALTIPADTVISTDCNAVETRLGGRVSVSGTKKIHGRITGSPTAPAVPTGDDAVELDLTLTFQDLEVSSSADANALLAKSGTLAGKLVPRLALAAASGACEVQSAIRRFSDLTWANGVLQVTSASGTFDLAVSSSDLSAVQGTWGTDSNVLSGGVTIDGTSYQVPGDQAGLDPSFSQSTHDSSWQCATGLLLPISHECSFTAPLAQGVARLSVKTLGTVASIVGADTSCGFSSMAVAGAPTVSGTVGHLGSLTFTVNNCTITFATDTALTPDCTGTSVHVEGAFTVSGTKTVAGWLTGNPLSPVVPASDAPAVVDLTSISFNNFKVTTSAGSLLSKSGTLSGTLQPRTALTTRGVCELQSPVARLSDVTWTNGNVTLVSAGKTFDVTVGSSALDAVNGTWGTDSNELTGTVTIGGTALPAVIDGLGADPTFNQATFDANWQCAPGLVLPVNHTNCSAKAVLAQGAGALIIKAVATANKMLNANTSCGFGAMSVLGAPTGSTGTAPGPGSITWSTAASPCLMHFPVDYEFATDCTGTVSHVMGDVTATVAKTVSGFLTGQPANPIVPITRTAAHFDLTSLVFTDFVVYDLKVGETVPTKKITLSGTVTGMFDPVAGQHATLQAPPSGGPVYSISTPVAQLTDIQLATGHVTVVLEGKTFDFDVANVDLDAFNGSFGGQSNHIAGTVSVDGTATSLLDPRLDPAFSQAAFDAAYVCTPDLLEVVPAN